MTLKSIFKTPEPKDKIAYEDEKNTGAVITYKVQAVLTNVSKFSPYFPIGLFWEN